MPRTAILYARSNRRENLDRQVRKLAKWCDRAGVVPIRTIAEVAIGVRRLRGGDVVFVGPSVTGKVAVTVRLGC